MSRFNGFHEIGSLEQASNFVETIESRQGLKVACIEEVAYRMKFIDAQQVLYLSRKLHKNNYGQYLQTLVERDEVNWNAPGGSISNRA